MKILQVIPTLGFGGAEQFTVELTNELVNQGYECDLVTLYDIEKNNKLLKKLCKKVKCHSFHKKAGLDIKCYYRLYRIIKEGKYDIVHAHVGAIPYILLSAVLLTDVKFVATIHSEAKREAGKSIMKWSRFFMFRHHKCIPVTISEESKASFDKYYKMDAAMVYNGVSPYNSNGIATLKDNKEQILFIHPASCQPVKNQKLLIKSFARFVVDYPNSKLIWLGNNASYMQLYQSLVPDMVEQFKYIGPVSNVRDYLIQADAMCLSSKMEGMPMTIIEAFSVGCPALCTPVGGIVNMIKDGKNGLLSKGLTVDDYYSMLKKFADQPWNKKQDMHRMAKNSYYRYSIKNTADGYLKIYNSKK